jgi:hypothetical protein
MKVEAFAEYLQHLRNQIPNREQTIHVICDVHTFHRAAIMITAVVPTTRLR